jgi:hypothetical protein
MRRLSPRETPVDEGAGKGIFTAKVIEHRTGYPMLRITGKPDSAAWLKAIDCLDQADGVGGNQIVERDEWGHSHVNSPRSRVNLGKMIDNLCLAIVVIDVVFIRLGID